MDTRGYPMDEFLIAAPFSMSDLTKENQKLVKELAHTQATRIYNGQNRNGRCHGEIWELSIQGMIAEVFVHQKLGWQMANQDYYDLIDDNGRNIEVKNLTGIDSMDHIHVKSLIRSYEFGEYKWANIHLMMFFCRKDVKDSVGLSSDVFRYIGKHEMERKFPIQSMKGIDPFK